MNATGADRLVQLSKELESNALKQYRPWSSYERAILTAAMLVQLDEPVRDGMDWGVKQGYFSLEIANGILRNLDIPTLP